MSKNIYGEPVLPVAEQRAPSTHLDEYINDDPMQPNDLSPQDEGRLAEIDRNFGKYLIEAVGGIAIMGVTYRLGKEGIGKDDILYSVGLGITLVSGINMLSGIRRGRRIKAKAQKG